MDNSSGGQDGWYKEGDLKFHFRESKVMRIDKQTGMQNKPSCDFGVDRGYPPYMLIEVKDPSNPNAPVEERIAFLENMTDDEFISKNFVHAAANSLEFVKNHEPIQASFQFFALLGLSRMWEIGMDISDLLVWQDAIRQELETLEKFELSDNAMVVDEDGWNELTEFELVRISTSEAA